MHRSIAIAFEFAIGQAAMGAIGVSPARSSHVGHRLWNARQKSSSPRSRQHAACIGPAGLHDHEASQAVQCAHSCVPAQGCHRGRRDVIDDITIIDDIMMLGSARGGCAARTTPSRQAPHAAQHATYACVSYDSPREHMRHPYHIKRADLDSADLDPAHPHPRSRLGRCSRSRISYLALTSCTSS